MIRVVHCNNNIDYATEPAIFLPFKIGKTRSSRIKELAD
jgi:hypothetical protein